MVFPTEIVPFPFFCRCDLLLRGLLGLFLKPMRHDDQFSAMKKAQESKDVPARFDPNLPKVFCVHHLAKQSRRNLFVFLDMLKSGQCFRFLWFTKRTDEFFNRSVSGCCFVELNFPFHGLKVSCGLHIFKSKLTHSDERSPGVEFG